ncbi:g-protein coupled receptor [Grosmannia clavigera kw1407]|uniref:G-protein coupled receptor n=1 Tax=Grosmannia clavigera (strain kw1407 / UAMH 11150) TaxID=655863 RepID=F0XQQ6_GROCL|nr:g-protein coupled receptor [Grosmannia clavigera kw1407]EFW99819.1 g-protein coupled receptor [Grosmannia clavigera kw1407]
MSENASPSMQLTREQAQVVVAVERAGASLSMLGVVLIIVTFASFKRLRNVPNTFILFASIANIGASIASLIGLAGIAQGSESALCRAQAFLLEMFMQSDPWWSFAMAFNVFLVFFFSASPTTFRRHLWVYCLVCFGLPMIPAIVCLYIKTKKRGPVYGDATLWCWIGDEWNSLRIFTYYIPIWVCIFFSAVIYVAVGYYVFHQRNQLRNLSLSNPAKEASSSENLTGGQPGFYGTVTTEVQITSDVCDSTLSGNRTPPLTPIGSPAQCPWGDGPFPQIATNIHPQRFQNALKRPLLDEEMGAIPYSSSSSSPPPPPPPLLSNHGSRGSAINEYPMATTTHQTKASIRYVNNAVISSSNVTPSHRRPQLSHFSVGDRFSRAWHRTWRRMSSKLRHMDPIKLAYLRTSFVFAISVLVTWTPSSINRIYALLYPTRVSYGLNIASATVLPLQGVWNAVIYFTTSWVLLREEVRRLGYRSRWFRRLAVKLGMGAIVGVDGIASTSASAGFGAGGSMRLRISRGRVYPGNSPGRPSAGGSSNLGVVGSGDGAGPSRGSLAGTGKPGGGGVDMRQCSRTKLDSDCFDDDSRDASRDASRDHDDSNGNDDNYGDNYHDDDTDDDSITDHMGRSRRRLRQGTSVSASASTSTEPGLGTRGPPGIGTMRVQKGGQLDT